MSNKVKIYTLIAILCVHACNAMKMTKKNVFVGSAGVIITGYTAHALTNKFSPESWNTRFDMVNQTLQDHPKTDLYIKNANNAISQVFKENIRFYWIFDRFFDKEFIKKDYLNEKREKSPSSQACTKAIKTMVQPTIDDAIDRTKNFLGNAALIAVPPIGFAIGLKAKKIPKNFFSATKTITKRIAVYGIGGGVATNALTYYFDNNPKKIVDWGMNTYGKLEPQALNELKAVCHNGLQIAKINFADNNNYLHLLIQENPMKETQLFVMDPQIMQKAVAEYYNDIIDIAIPKSLQSPIKAIFPPIKIESDLFKIDTNYIMPIDGSNDDDNSTDEESDDDQKKKKKNNRTQRNSIKIKRLTDY